MRRSGPCKMPDRSRKLFTVKRLWLIIASTLTTLTSKTPPPHKKNAEYTEDQPLVSIAPLALLYLLFIALHVLAEHPASHALDLVPGSYASLTYFAFGISESQSFQASFSGSVLPA